MSKSKQCRKKEAKQKMKKMPKPSATPQQPQQRNAKDMSTEELALMQGQEYTRIIQAQAVIQQAQTNISNITAELQKRHKAKENKDVT